MHNSLKVLSIYTYSLTGCALCHLTLIVKCRYVMPSSFNISLRDIIRKLLEPDLSKRYGNLKEGPTDIKKHKWFKDINWMEMFNRKVKSPLVPPCRHLSDQRTDTSALVVSEANEFEEEFKNF